jgi:hypothetical protein
VRRADSGGLIRKPRNQESEIFCGSLSWLLGFLIYFEFICANWSLHADAAILRRPLHLFSIYLLRHSQNMSWKCHICEIEHEEVPLCFSIEAPWRALVPEAEFAQRVELTKDQCVVDGQHFFIRGHVEISIHDYPEPLSFSVWSSLSEQSFVHMTERWESPDRALDSPYFGWLSSPIAFYPSTIHLKLSVQSRPPGLTPLFTVAPTEHPLAIDQHNGITIERWYKIAHHLLHGCEPNMQNLADALLNYFWFLNFCTDEQMHPDTAVQQMENLVYSIENDFNDAERAALQEAAKRSLAAWLREPGGITAKQKEFLQSIINGRFNGWPADEDDEEE